MSKCESCGKESDRLAPLSSGQMICGECRDQIADAELPPMMTWADLPSWSGLWDFLVHLFATAMIVAALAASSGSSPLAGVYGLLWLVCALLTLIYAEVSRSKK